MPQKRKAPGKSTASDPSGAYHPSSGMSSPHYGAAGPSSAGNVPAPGPGRQLSREQLRKANHSLIERRRREKMNAAYSALRSLVPSLADEEEGKGGETFKLEVLERTVVHMKELKERVAELEAELEEVERRAEGSASRQWGVRAATKNAEVSSQGEERASEEDNDESDGETHDGTDVDASGETDAEASPEKRRRHSPPRDISMNGRDAKLPRLGSMPRSPLSSSASSPRSPPAGSSSKVIWHSPASRRMRAAAHVGPAPGPGSAAGSPAMRHSPLSPHNRSQRSTMSAPLSIADSDATVPEEGLPAAGTIHPSSRKSKSSSEGSGSTTTGGGTMEPPPPPQRLPELARDNNNTPSSIVALLAADASSAAVNPSSGSSFGRFAMPNLPSEAARAARVAAGAGEIRNPDLYLPPPVQSASPSSPFFMVDPGRDEGARGLPGQPFGRITEPSPLLPPLMGVNSLFPGVAALRQDSDGNGNASAAERDPISHWRRSPPMRHAPSSVTSSTTGSSIGLTDDSPRFGPSGGERSGSIEEQAATLLLSFSSPEVLTPMHYPSGIGANGYGQGYLDKWTLDQQTAAAASHERRPSDGWRDGGFRSAKTASDILEMGRP